MKKIYFVFVLLILFCSCKKDKVIFYVTGETTQSELEQKIRQITDEYNEIDIDTEGTTFLPDGRIDFFRMRVDCSYDLVCNLYVDRQFLEKDTFGFIRTFCVACEQPLRCGNLSGLKLEN